MVQRFWLEDAKRVVCECIALSGQKKEEKLLGSLFRVNVKIGLATSSV